MRIPRDIDGKYLGKLLSRYGYELTRQTGSHIRLTSTFRGNEHHVTIPDHSPLRVGTLNSVLGEIASYLNIDKEQLIRDIFD